MDFTRRFVEFSENIGKNEEVSGNTLRKLISLLDLTSLTGNETEDTLKALCLKANNFAGKVAAICVLPEFVASVARCLTSPDIHIASVANFPTGKEEPKAVLKTIQQAINAGAKELDIVFPYSLFLTGKEKEAFAQVKDYRNACGKHLMKIILEISEFQHTEQIYTASLGVLESGADFIKTSTGKSQHGATLESATAMLLAIKDHGANDVGFKASGGIQTIPQAYSFLELAREIMGEAWIHPKHLRIGASQLLNHILSHPELQQPAR